MADFSVALEQLRGALEVAEGSATTPTRILSTGAPGNVDISGLLKHETIEDRRAAGTRTSLRATYGSNELNTLVLSNIPVSYQEIGWWLTLAAPSGGGVPGTVDTSAYGPRTFTPVEGTAVNTYGGTAGGFYTANLQYGALDFASTLVYKLPAMRLTNLTFRWDKRGTGTDTGLMMDATLMMSKGTATQGTAFDGSLTAGTPTLALGNQVKAYVDAASTALGTTLDNQITSATFGLELPLTQHFGFDGVLGPTSSHYAQQWVPTLSITRRFSDKTELTAYINRTTRAFQFFAEGGVIGASTATNQFKFNAIVSPTDHTVTQVDGLYYAEIQYEGIYDPTHTTSWSATLRNSVAAAYTAT